MKPKDLLNRRQEQFVIPSAEALDFHYLESQRRFKRKIGDLNQVIGIELRSRNYEDSCAFSVGFHFESRDLQKWRDQHLKGNPFRKYHRDFVWGGSDYRIPDWPQKEVKRFFGLLPPRKGVRRHFHLTNSSDDVTEMQVLKECIEGPLLTFFNRLSTF